MLSEIGAHEVGIQRGFCLIETIFEIGNLRSSSLSSYMLFNPISNYYSGGGGPIWAAPFKSRVGLWSHQVRAIEIGAIMRTAPAITMIVISVIRWHFVSAKSL